MPTGKMPVDIVASNVNNYYYRIVINHCTYPLRIQTELLGNTACAKRLTERMFAKIQFIMVRLTNLNSMLGSQVPNMQSDLNYVVLRSLKRLKQVLTRSELIGERPKVNTRHRLMEFGILHHLERCGERRNRNTTIISRKGSSLTQLTNFELSGFYEGQQLLKLQSDLTNGLKAKNLSIIMSNPDFLVSCWVRIRFNKGSLTPAFDGSIDGIKESWFIETAGKIKNGGYIFQADKKYIFKSNSDKLRFLTMPSPKDKIVLEGMRFLLEIIFEPLFRNSSYGWRSNRGCLTALNDIQMKCKGCSWYIEGYIDQQFSTLNHNILISIIKTKVDDQAFIDLLYKYIKVGYEENVKKVTPMQIGLIQGGILSPILANIYMNSFDEWVEYHLMSIFNTGNKREKNPKYFKKYYQDGLKVKDKSIRSILNMNPSYKRMYYFRYGKNYLIGVEGSKEDCEKLKNEINAFLQNKLNMVLNLNKTKITNATKNHAKFLGYRIHKTKITKMPIRRNKLGRLFWIVPRLVLDAPIDEIVKKLIERKYAIKAGNPTRNGRFINHDLSDIINHYRAIERRILNYYSLCNNYGKLAVRVHFILKYSCVLTIAAKMKLKTKKKVFKKYGKDLKIFNEKGKIIACYPTIDYKRPIKFYLKSFKNFDENFIEKIDTKVRRGQRD
jgi:retron-type reverse transcriptase